MAKKTPKQLLQAQAKSLKVKFTEKTTMKELEKLIAAANKAAEDAAAEKEGDGEEGGDDRIRPEGEAEAGEGGDAPDSEEDAEVDYLRPYQYGKEMALGSPHTDPVPGSKAAAMKAHLLKQTRVRTLIPSDEGSDPKVPFTVNLNGYRLDFPKRKYIDVPEQISQVIMKSQKQTEEAGKQFLFDRDESKDGIKMSDALS